MITIAVILALNQPKPDMEPVETPPAIVQTVEAPIPIQPVPEPPVVTWRDNPNKCDESTQYISAEPPFLCINKPVKTYKAKIVSAPVSSAGNTYVKGNCTWFVKSRLNWVRNGWGDARSWASRARSQGFLVNNEPRVGSVAQTTSGRLGHVAVVTGVSGGMVSLQEMNYEGLGVVSTRSAPISSFVYIHSN